MLLDCGQSVDGVTVVVATSTVVVIVIVFILFCPEEAILEIGVVKAVSGPALGVL